VDDSKEVLEHRLGVYAEQTAPLITAYQARGLLRSINGMGSVDQVKQRLLAAVGL
jgi:adenylate kinase